MNISIYTLSQYASGELKDTYEPEEIRSICRLIFMDVFHYTNIDIHIQKHENLPESFLGKFQEIIARLKQGEPIQYIIGTTEFAGLTFTVNPQPLSPDRKQKNWFCGSNPWLHLHHTYWTSEQAAAVLQ